MGTESAPDPAPDTADATDVAATLAGDGAAYRRLVQRHERAIAAQMRRFSRDPTVFEALTHDVFVEAYFSLRAYRGSAPLVHWLRKIAVRIGYRYWKQNAGREDITLSADDWNRMRGPAPAPDTATDAAELVHVLLARLSPADRLVLTLLYLDGCSVRQAAERAGWTVVGTKVRALRARNRLRSLIAEGEP